MWWVHKSYQSINLHPEQKESKFKAEIHVKFLIPTNCDPFLF